MGIATFSHLQLLIVIQSDLSHITFMLLHLRLTLCYVILGKKQLFIHLSNKVQGSLSYFLTAFLFNIQQQQPPKSLKLSFSVLTFIFCLSVCIFSYLFLSFLPFCLCSVYSPYIYYLSSLLQTLNFSIILFVAFSLSVFELYYFLNNDH